MQTVVINDFQIEVSKLEVRHIVKDGKQKTLLEIEFPVTSEAYHDVTVLLYKNDFIVQVPEQGLEIEATIYNYSTSITDLYEEGNVGEFKLVLIEKG